MTVRRVHVFGGGTFSPIAPHLALAAPAFGSVARQIREIIQGSALFAGAEVRLHLTKMADPESSLLTNHDVKRRVEEVLADEATGVIVMSVAFADFDAVVPGKPGKRIESRNGPEHLELKPVEKVVELVRRQRKDVFLVAFKTTAGATPRAQYEAGLSLLKRASANLVLANDVETRLNMVVTPELAHYYVTREREAAIRGLLTLADRRSRLTFTRTTLLPGELVPWTSPEVPSALRSVVEHCVARGAYSPFNGVTVGHFAFRTGQNGLTSSRRKQNYNLPDGRDLVRVAFEADRLLAYGAKPSAGTRSQYAVLSRFPDFDCIVHFHCPRRPDSIVPLRPQHDFECGSHECGENTWSGMQRFGPIAAVMLDRHGPNVCFHRDTDPREVIGFIEANFDLTRRSDSEGLASAVSSQA